ncbi:MAG: prealbumin-like fold domain-containing protein [Bacilli bacterium]
MKKIICTLILILAFGQNDIVSANEGGEFKEKIYKKSDVKVFEDKNILYYSTYSNIHVYWQDKYVNDKYSYCLLFEDLIKDGNEHTLENPIDYYKEDVWNKISLIAMYGERQFAVTKDKKYRLATQALIHETVNSKTKMKFYDMRSNKKEFSVSSYKQEILNLYNNHLILPNLDLNSVDFKVGDEYIFNDSNNVIDRYHLVTTNNNVKFEKKDNKLKITVINQGENSFSLVSDKYYKDGEILLWVSSKYQDLVSVTYFNPSKIDYSFISTNKVGSLTINKIDSVSRKELSGAEFKLQRENGNNLIDIKTFIVDRTFFIDNLEYGKYILTEIKAPDGYSLSESVYKFEINDDSNNIKLKVENQKVLPKTGLKNNIFLFSFLLILLNFLKKIKVNLSII